MVRKNSDHAGEQKCRSRWGIGFLQSDQFYSVFVSATLASRSQHERGSGTECLRGGYTLKRVPTLSIVRAKKLVVWKNSYHAGEQKRRSRWGVGFLKFDQFYSAFDSVTFASRS